MCLDFRLGHQPPRPALARVKLTVRDAATSKPLEGECEVLRMIGRRDSLLRMIGREPAIESRTAFHNGQLTVEAPATARLRISAPGHTPVVKSIFVDDPRLLDSALHMRPEQLTDWRTFETVRAMLRDVEMRVDLKL
jgi:hypothetical protein